MREPARPDPRGSDSAWENGGSTVLQVGGRNCDRRRPVREPAHSDPRGGEAAWENGGRTVLQVGGRGHTVRVHVASTAVAVRRVMVESVFNDSSEIERLYGCAD